MQKLISVLSSLFLFLHCVNYPLIYYDAILVRIQKIIVSVIKDFAKTIEIFKIRPIQNIWIRNTHALPITTNSYYPSPCKYTHLTIPLFWVRPLFWILWWQALSSLKLLAKCYLLLIKQYVLSKFGYEVLYYYKSEYEYITFVPNRQLSKDKKPRYICLDLFLLPPEPLLRKLQVNIESEFTEAFILWAT